MSDDETAAERLKALGHPVRLAIVRALAERSRCCCADVCSGLPLAQSTVSQHLKVLKEAGLVSFRRDLRVRCGGGHQSTLAAGTEPETAPTSSAMAARSECSATKASGLST